MTTERMASEDAAWLHMDQPVNRMVVHTALLFDQPPDWRAVTNAIRHRLVRAFPRFSQRVVEPPVTLAPLTGPSWERDPDFRLGNHLHHRRLRGPSGDEALAGYVSSQMSIPLDRTRPLWEAHCLDGYGEGSALLLRTHHAMADGVALTQVVLALTDPEREDADGGRMPIAEPGGLGQLGGAPALARRALEAAWSRSPAELGAAAVANAAMLRKLGFELSSDGGPLHAPVGLEKRAAWLRPVPLSSIRERGGAAGCTVNDVMLAGIAGGLRRYLLERGPLPETVRAIVPVNRRPAGASLPRGLGNDFGLVFVDLPVGAAGGRERLRRIQEQMARIKSSEEGRLVHGALGLMGFTPVRVERTWVDLFAARADAVITNVVGPRHRVLLAGTPVARLVGWVPASGPIGLGLSILSYDGRVTLGVAADAGIVPDCAPLVDALEAEIGALCSVGARP